MFEKVENVSRVSKVPTREKVYQFIIIPISLLFVFIKHINYEYVQDI